MKKKIIIGLVLLVIFIVIGYYVGSNKNISSKLKKYYENETTYLKKNNDNPEYFNYEGIEYKRIKIEDAKKIADKNKAVCGLTQMDNYSREEDINLCFENIGKNSIVYIENGTSYYMRPAMDCNNNTDEDEEEYGSTKCELVDKYYDMAKLSFIDNAKNIIARINQFNGVEFLFETTKGELYYFMPLGIDDDRAAVIAKVTLPSKLKSFNNIEDGESPYGTDIVLVLEDNNKYVVKYNYNTNKAFLVKYDDYLSGNYDEMGGNDVSDDEFVEISLDSKIETKSYVGREAFDTVKNELNKKNSVLNIGNPKLEDTYGTLGINNGKVTFEVNYPNEESTLEQTRFIVSSIPSPVGVYMPQGISTSADFVVEFYVINNKNDIYVVNFTLRDPDSNKTIYKVK